MSRFAYLACAAAVYLTICRALPGQPTTPVILISVDTLRADHLGCYQPSRRHTPQIDKLAQSGTLFSQASSPYPLTLPAHAALLTSTYPFANGVEDNGIPLKSAAATLATVLKSAGYRTAAFVSSFVLDRRFGLNRGFDLYDGPLDLHNKTTPAPVERKRPGAQTVEAATRWIERNSSSPFFLFLHLYDLHLPYDLPQDPSQRHGETGYTAELAYEDRVLGDFVAFLERRGLLQKSLLVFTSDHGEGLRDHGETTHGYFIYQSTLHVPMIFRWPASGKRIPQQRVDEPATLLDVAPTILEAIGAARPPSMRGASLVAASGERPVYSESLYARNHFGCASIRSLRLGRYKYIAAPKPELYDLSSDPGEAHDLYAQQQTKAADLAGRIAALRAGSTAAKPAAPSAETIRTLRSLGYLSGAPTARETRIDPKDRAADFERYLAALALSGSGKVNESSAVLASLRDKLPDVADIRISLGSNQQRSGDYAAAAREFQRAAELAPDDAQARFELGFCQFHLRHPAEAIQAMKAALALQPWYTRADEALADIYLQQKDFAQARFHLNHLLSIDPNSYTAHYNLGILAAMAKNWNEAQQHIQAALRADPSSAEAHDTLGGIYVQRGDFDKALPQFQEAVRLQPRLASAHYNLAMLLQKQGRSEEAAAELRAAQEAERQ